MKNKHVIGTFLLFLTIWLALPLADISAEPIMPPMPPPFQMEGLRIDYQRVDVTIENQIATTHVDMAFVNESEFLLEGTYLFPLPEGATVTELTMWIDGLAIESKILEAGEAREIYNEIVRQLRDPALLEYVGTSAIQANVFPIPAGETRRIEIEYQQVLMADGGLLRYVFPQSADLYTNLPLDSQSIRVDVRSNDAMRAIYSPTHRVAVNRIDDFHATLGYEGSAVQPKGDFELLYSISSEAVAANLISYKEAGEDGFFMLLAAPGVTVDQVVARDIVLVFDTSGSMDGQKMAQAKDAARYIVEHLNPEDRFNIISFSTGTRHFENGMVSAAQPGDYGQFIDNLEAVGGTNISLALLEAMTLVDGSRPSTIIFLTDGLATEGIVDTAVLIDTVAAETAAGTRVFAFGVGDDVDTFLLDTLTQNNRGTTTYVRSHERIDEVVSGFFSKVSTPVLADIDIDFGGINAEQLYPTTRPDLFAGSQLVLVGRYRSGGDTTITLSGDVNGETQTFTYEDMHFAESDGDDFIPRLWATRAIGHLQQQIRLNGENAEYVESIVNLSLRYGIITPYTSYLIEEDDIFSQTARQGFVDDVAEEGEAVSNIVSGSTAVDAASSEADLADAEAPMAAPTYSPENAGNEVGGSIAVASPVQYVGSKTFVWRDGVWIDTQFNPDSITLQSVGFLSDDYFRLLEAAPEAGQYLALGEQVIVVLGDNGYEIVAGEGDEEITLPSIEATSTTSPAIDATTEVATPTTGDAQPTEPTATAIPVEGSTTTSESNEKPRSTPCTAAMIMPLMLGIGAYSFRKRR